MRITPLFNLLPPLAQRCLVRQGGVFLLYRFYLGNQFSQYRLDRAHYRYISHHRLGDRRRVHVDVNYLGSGAELLHRVGHAVVKACTHRKNTIAVVHGHVGLVKAVHP